MGNLKLQTNYPPGNKAVKFNEKPFWLLGWSGCYEQEKYLLPLPGFKPPALQPVA
jgi:hypothetical protein